jgi:hypothetical protein
MRGKFSTRELTHAVKWVLENNLSGYFLDNGDFANIQVKDPRRM